MAPQSSPAAGAAPIDPTESLSGSIIACVGVMLAVSTIAIGLRFYVRGKLLRAISAEDWCILAAWVFTAVAGGLTIKEAQLALGKHFVTVSPADMSAWKEHTYIKTLFYNLSLCFTKISILLLYLRLFKTFTYLRIAIWGVLGIVVVYNLWSICMYLTFCIPLQKYWHPQLEGYCHPVTVWWALTYLHIVSDFLIFVLPIPGIVPMSIPRTQRAGLLCLLCIGFFVCLISVLRTVWLNNTYMRADPTWHYTSIANWSTVEINTAVVCACLMTTKPLFSRLFGSRKTKALGPPSAPLTIGSSPLRAIKGRIRGSGFTRTTDVESRSGFADENVKLEQSSSEGVDAINADVESGQGTVTTTLAEK
jgi:hypothetical protein